MKLAVLVSGTFPDYLPDSILSTTIYKMQRIFFNLNHEVDFYYHTWNNKLGEKILQSPSLERYVDLNEILTTFPADIDYYGYNHPRLYSRPAWKKLINTPKQSRDDSYYRYRHRQHEAFAHLVKHLKEKNVYYNYDIIIRTRWDSWFASNKDAVNTLNSLIWNCKANNVVTGIQLFIGVPKGVLKSDIYNYMLEFWSGTKVSRFKGSLFDQCILLKPKWCDEDIVLKNILNKNQLPDHIGWWDILTNDGERQFMNWNGLVTIPKNLFDEDVHLFDSKISKLYK